MGHCQRAVAERSRRAASTRRRRAGVTIVEVCAGLSLLGVFLAAAVPTFIRKLEVSRISEAPEQLEAMYKGMLAYHGAMQTLPEGGRGIGCFPPAAGPTPALPSVTAVEVDFLAEDEPGSATWEALGFAPARPLRYRYTFMPLQAGCEPPEPVPDPIVRWRAEGDLDGDGELSLFERSARLEGSALRSVSLLFVKDRTE